MAQQLESKVDYTGAKTLKNISRMEYFNKWMYNQIKPFLHGKVLEIGSGWGNISKFAFEDKKDLTISDYSPEYISRLKETFKDLIPVSKILTINIDHPEFVTEYAEYKEKFDTIFILNVIEHIRNDGAACKNMHFLLKQGGNLVVLAPAYQWLFCNLDKELGHYRRYSLKSLKELVYKNGFGISKAFYFNAFGILGWLLSGKIFQKKMLGTQELSLFNILVPFMRITDTLLLKKIGLSAIVTGRKQ